MREVRRLRVLWRIFGPKWDEVTGEWRTLHTEDLNNMYCSPIIVGEIKSRRMRWAGHVARIAEVEAFTEFGWGDLWERDHLGDPGIDGRIILRWLSGSEMLGYGLDRSGSG